MKKFLAFLIFLSGQFIFSQNTLSYSPANISVNANSGVEVLVPITVTCSGSNPSLLVNIAPTNSCSATDGYLGLNFTNGITAITPGQSTVIHFRFKKTVSTNTSITYQFTNGGSCFSPLISISVNYLVQANGGEGQPNWCPGGIPGNLQVTNIQSTSVNLSWYAIPYATNYRIYVNDKNQINYNNYIDVQGNVTNYLLDGLLSGKQYYIFIRSLVLNCGSYSQAAEATFTTQCQIYNSPSNLSATPSGSGYIIDFTPFSNFNGYYMLDYVNLSNNSSGSLTIYPGAYFYYVSFPSSFKFKIRPVGSCFPSESVWLTVVPSSCLATNYPSSLSFSAQSVCGSTPGRCCGYGQFSWSTVSGAIRYEIEYMGVNLTNAGVPPVTGSFQTTSIRTVQPTKYACNSNQAGTWILKYRVRTQCSNGTWSNFSPWSANFAW